MRLRQHFCVDNIAAGIRMLPILLSLNFLLGCNQQPEDVGKVWTNPTSYVFSEGRDAVALAIEGCFRDFKYGGFSLHSKKGGIRPVDTLTIFDQPGNLNDYFLSSMPGVPVGKSRQYLVDGDSIDYFASFHLHVTDFGVDSTKVEVFTVRPRVLVGESLLPKPPHFRRTLEYYDVAPTTVEEYQILLELGTCIGERGMPELLSH